MAFKPRNRIIRLSLEAVSLAALFEAYVLSGAH